MARKLRRAWATGATVAASLCLALGLRLCAESFALGRRAALAPLLAAPTAAWAEGSDGSEGLQLKSIKELAAESQKLQLHRHPSFSALLGRKH